MSNFSEHTSAINKKRSASNLYQYASANLEVCQIRERLIGIKSQHEPMSGILKRKIPEKEKLYAISYYVVTGQLPWEKR